MEGFANQVKNYFKQIEALIKELHRNLINEDKRQIYISPFTVRGGVEAIRITGKGIVKEIIINGKKREGYWRGLEIRTDNTLKINVPNSNKYDTFAKNPDENGSSYLSIKDNISFSNSFSIYAKEISGDVYGHIVYTLDE